MERLTKRDENGNAHYPYCYEKCDGDGIGIRCQTCDFEEKICDKLAEYEDLEEQGLLLKLPVAIGSDVYFIPSKANFGLNVLHHHEEFNRVYHQKIARIHFTENRWYAEGNLNLEYGLVDRVFVDKLYKETWFLTEQEAQSALEKMKAGGE